MHGNFLIETLINGTLPLLQRAASTFNQISRSISNINDIVARIIVFVITELIWLFKPKSINITEE